MIPMPYGSIGGTNQLKYSSPNLHFPRLISLSLMKCTVVLIFVYNNICILYIYIYTYRPLQLKQYQQIIFCPRHIHPCCVTSFSLASFPNSTFARMGAIEHRFAEVTLS